MKDKNEILDSGLLELYVIGALSEAEKKEVHAALEQYPELKHEIYAIEKSLYAYAQGHAVKAPDHIKEELIAKVKNQKDSLEEKSSSSTSSSYLLPFILATLTSLALLTTYLIKQQAYQELLDQANEDKIVCDSIQAANQEKQILLADLSSPTNKILQGQATDNYPETKLIIHHNPSTRKNYLQLDELPELAADQSYQLWSLKDGVDPIPLNVFQGDTNIFEVDFVANTNAYAITIEQRGGAEVPDLTKLIVVIPVA